MKNTPDNLHTTLSTHLKVCDYLNRPYPYGLEEVSMYIKGFLLEAKVNTLGENLIYIVNGNPVMEYCPSLGYIGIVIGIHDHLKNLLTEDMRKDSDIILSIVVNHHLGLETTSVIPLYDDHFRDGIYRE